jgi:hypothetical protein
VGVDDVVETAFGQQVRVTHVGDDVAREWVLTQRLHKKRVGLWWARGTHRLAGCASPPGT